MENERRQNVFSKLIKLVRPSSDPKILDTSSKNIKKAYKFHCILGSGAFGTIYLCTDRKSGIRYACKSISKEKIKSGALPATYVRREVDIMKSLPCHPNIVTLKETFEDRENVHLIMEYCERGELMQSIKTGGHFKETEAKVLIKQIVHIIQCCHEYGIMHPDLKPENLLFGRGDVLKAIDFGMAICFRPGQRFRESVGSPAYMAPEVFLHNYGPEADIWSAGVILYQLLCGRRPFNSGGNRELLKEKIFRSEIDFSRHPWPTVSDRAKALVKGMLERNHHKRLTPPQILNHPWLRNDSGASTLRVNESVAGEGDSHRPISVGR